MSYLLLAEIVDAAKQTGKPFWRIILEDHCREQGCTEATALSTMGEMYAAMAAANRDYDPSVTVSQ